MTFLWKTCVWPSHAAAGRQQTNTSYHVFGYFKDCIIPLDVSTVQMLRELFQMNLSYFFYVFTKIICFFTYRCTTCVYPSEHSRVYFKSNTFADKILQSFRTTFGPTCLRRAVQEMYANHRIPAAAPQQQQQLLYCSLL